MLPVAIEREVRARLDAEHAAALGAECEGSRYHSPRPLVTRPAELPDGSTVQLCGTCWDNLTLLLTLQGTGELPWDAHRQFGNEIRKLGRRTR